MKFIVFSLLISFSSFAQIDLSGHILGVSEHKSKPIHKTLWGSMAGCFPYALTVKMAPEGIWTTRYATRAYLRKIEDEPGNYNMIILEYARIREVAPKFILSSLANKSSKFERLSNKLGYLKTIIRRVSTYKAIPTNSELNTYKLLPLKIRDGKLHTNDVYDPSYLKLAKNIDSTKPLKGAVITKGDGGEPARIFFPQGGLKSLVQFEGYRYHLIKDAYKWAKLESSWKTKLPSNPYLGAYGDKSDAILEIEEDGEEKIARFTKNISRSHLATKKREAQLTNPISAHIEGDFRISRLAEGMFTFKPTGVSNQDLPNKYSRENIEGRIGVSIDIFDSSKNGQYVDEVILIDPNDPENFLMYYEHPDFGNKE